MADGQGGAGDLGTWLGVGVAVVAAGIAWLTYRSQSNHKQLEYLVMSVQRLVSRRVATELQVSFDGRVVADPSLTVVRMVCTGDKGIPADTFEGPLTLTLKGAEAIVSASVSAVRPVDLPVVLRTEGIHTHIDPLLLNPGDFIEVQALADGLPQAVSLNARIADVVPKRRASLPYPPGSGPEGQMLGFDKFMWSVPVLILAGIAFGIVGSTDLSTTATIAWAVAVTIVFFVIYPLRVRFLVTRRRNWRP